MSYKEWRDGKYTTGTTKVTLVIILLSYAKTAKYLAQQVVRRKLPGYF